MLKKIFISLVLLALSTSFSSAASLESIQQRLQQIDPNLVVANFSPAPLQDFYQVELSNGALIYLHKETNYLLTGNILKLNENGSIDDLTSQALSQIHIRQLQELDTKDLISFPAQGKKRAQIYVFTDVTCPYCSRLHEQVPALNKAGIEVSYIAFPRQGSHSEGYKSLVSVWCAKDKQQAMTHAKQGKKIAAAECVNPIQDHYLLGQRMGIQGTPAIFLPDGRIIPGFVPAEKLIEELNL